MSKGELVIYSKANNHKRSFLRNLAITYVKQGRNVVYLTHEQSPDDIFKKLYVSFEQLGLYDKQHDRNCQIKYLHPEKTVGDIKAYIDLYESSTGKVVDVIISDYMDLLSPLVPIEDSLLRKKQIAHELSAFVKNRNADNKPLYMITYSTLSESDIAP